MYNKILRIVNKLKKYKHHSWRLIYTILKRNIYLKINYRPSSKPYLSGDTYRLMCDYSYENQGLVKLKDGDIVFASLYSIYKLEREALNQNKKFILVTHQSDDCVTEKNMNLLESKSLIRWYAQNSKITHEKLIKIPIGLEDYWRSHAGDKRHFDSLRRNKVQKKDRIIWGFNDSTNITERTKARNILSSLKIADEVNVPPYIYRKKLNNYKFVASPPGNGPDCHRTWEAIYLGVIPIVIYNSVYDQFIDLPIWFINNWEEIIDYDEKKLNEKYMKIVNNSKTHLIWAKYWESEIRR